MAWVARAAAGLATDAEPPAGRSSWPAKPRSARTPHDVVFETGTLQAAPLPAETPATYAEPVLFCYALVNRPYILDLQPDKSVVQQYLDAGFDVYLIDWGVPSDADPRLTLEDYVCGLLEERGRLHSRTRTTARICTSSATAWAGRCRAVRRAPSRAGRRR